MISYVSDWSPVSRRRYRRAQAAEQRYWNEQDRRLLTLESRYFFYCGYYEWAEHRDLINPFSIEPSRPQNFQIPPDVMEGRVVLDVGCGPMSHSISLVHCATVHVVDPLLDLYREIQPFGWEFFGSASSAGAEELPFESESFDFVHCRNVLDHAQDADRILNEIERVLRPGGQLLMGCHVRSRRGRGPPHPYKWDVETLEARLLSDYTLVRPALLTDGSGSPAARVERNGEPPMWVGCLRK